MSSTVYGYTNLLATPEPRITSSSPSRRPNWWHESRRPCAGGPEPEPFLLGDLAIHYEHRRVTVAGRPVTLTATEYELLRVLSLSAGRVVTSDALLRQAWGGRESANPKVLRAFVKTLRRKLGDDAARPAYIFNERGVGYRMAEPDDR